MTHLRRSLAIVRRLYTVRSCSDNLPVDRRERPCLDFYIGRCLPHAWMAGTGYRGMIDEVLSSLVARST